MKVIASGGAGPGRKCGGKKGAAVFHNEICRRIWRFQLCAILIKIKTETDRERDACHCWLRGCFAYRREGEKPASSWAPRLTPQDRKEAGTQADAVQAQGMPGPHCSCQGPPPAGMGTPLPPPPNPQAEPLAALDPLQQPEALSS